MAEYRISIVTPSYNQGQYLEKTIRSIVDQAYTNLEYIIIDGGSSDNSVEIISRHEKHLAYWISECDRGQVNAINKGLDKCTGDIVAYINSDDLYLPGAFAAVVDHFANNPECQWLCGDTIMFGEGHKTELVKTRVPKSAAQCLSWAYTAPQPGMFWKRELLLNGFDESWNYCFDHDLYIRLLLQGYTCNYIKIPLAAYRLHSKSKTVAEAMKFEKEFDLIAEKYEPRLKWTDRQFSKATRFIRKSHAFGAKSKIRESFIELGRAFITHPGIIRCRPFWGTIKLLGRNILARIKK